MKARFLLLPLLMAMALMFAFVPVSHAGDTISIGLQEAGVNGGAITTVASGTSGLVGFSGVYGTFINQISATGSPVIPEPGLDSTAVNVSSTTAATLTVYVTEQGLTAPLTGVLSGFTSNLFGLPSGSSVTESTYIDTANGLYVLNTQLGTYTFTSAGVQTQGSGVPVITGPYSVTEVFTIVATGVGVVNDTISLSSVPEPTGMALLGTGLLAVGGLLKKKLLS